MDSPTTLRNIRRTLKSEGLPQLVQKKSLVQILKSDPEQFRQIITTTIRRTDFIVDNDLRRPTILFHISNFEDLILAINNSVCDGHILNTLNSVGMNFLQYSITTYYWWNANKLVALSTNYKITSSIINSSYVKKVKSPIELVKPMIAGTDECLKSYYQNPKFDLYRIRYDGSYSVLNLVIDPSYYPHLHKIIKYLDSTKLKNIKTTLFIPHKHTLHGRHIRVQKMYKDVTFYTLLHQLNPELYDKLFASRPPEFNRDVQEYIMSRFDPMKKRKLIDFAEKSEKKEECRICCCIGSVVVFSCGHSCCSTCCLKIIEGNRLCYNCRTEIKTTILLY